MNSDPVAQDATGFSGVKRPGLICRYFLNNGDCFYGSNCQYSHEMPGAVASIDAVPQVTDEGSYWLHSLLKLSIHTASRVCIRLAVCRVSRVRVS